MNITKAVITAAGRGQRTLPLQTLIDSDGAVSMAGSGASQGGAECRRPPRRPWRASMNVDDDRKA